MVNTFADSAYRQFRKHVTLQQTANTCKNYSNTLIVTHNMTVMQHYHHSIGVSYTYCSKPSTLDSFDIFD